MIKKDKNKTRLEAKSKILVLGLMLIVSIGLFSPMMKVSAAGTWSATSDSVGTCTTQVARTVTTSTQAKGICESDPHYKTWITTTDSKGNCTTQVARTVTTVPNKTKAECDALGGVTLTPTNSTTSTTATSSTIYTLLAPLPCPDTAGATDPNCKNGKLTTFDPGQKNNLGAYLNLMIEIFIGLCAVLSVVMIVIGGLEYMTSELIASKEEGKHRITNAIFGLLLALGAFALLYTINPDLLNSDLNPAPVTIPNTPGITPGTSTNTSGTAGGDPQGTCTTSDGNTYQETESACGELNGNWKSN